MNVAAAKLAQPAPDPDTAERTLIIIGCGPVGMHLASCLRRHQPNCRIKMFGRENWAPYDRVSLTALLAGKRSLDQLYTPLAQMDDDIELMLGLSIRMIDRHGRLVMDDLGNWHAYTDLFIATGSSPHVPDIPGVDLSGVFRFRDMADAQALMARGARTRHTVVIGGGLLGIEAARAMASLAETVTLIQHSDRLMNRQLDNASAAMVSLRLEQANVQVRLNTRASAVLGDPRVTGLRLSNDEILACDTVIFATGIRPNTVLAREAGLLVADGIRINEQARTNDPHIYAAGECAQFEDELFGLVAPGLEQASVAAAVSAGVDARYLGSIGATRLKVLDLSCFSAGRVSDAWQQRIDQSPHWQQGGENYRRIFLSRGRLMGAIAIGPCPEQARLQSAIQQRTLVWPWQLWRFRRHGLLWPEGGSEDVRQWPAGAVVCQCRQITRGQLGDCVEGGCATPAALSSATGAATVCGSCEPLLQQLCGEPASKPGMASRLLLPGTMLLLTMLASLFVHGPLGYASSAEQIGLLESLWRDGLARQISGYTLLGLSVLAAALALRKRWSRLQFGTMPGWRIVHVVVGVAIVAALLVHTGMRMGHGSNLALMSTYLAVMVGGSLAALLMARAESAPSPARRARTGAGIWLHILTLWPLPVLLAVHIFKAYFF